MCSWIYYFGYGSLVNRDTRPAGETAIPAALTGWQRVWGHRVAALADKPACCSLSILPGEGVIDGVVVRLPREKLAELDQRESGYQRLQLPLSMFEFAEDRAKFRTQHSPPAIDADTVYVYQSLPENRCQATDDHPILQSYADCVMAGYERIFGPSGLAAFLNSTQGWQGTIDNDRAAPRYPRAVTLSAQQLTGL